MLLFDCCDIQMLILNIIQCHTQGRRIAWSELKWLSNGRYWRRLREIFGVKASWFLVVRNAGRNCVCMILSFVGHWLLPEGIEVSGEEGCASSCLGFCELGAVYDLFHHGNSAAGLCSLIQKGSGTGNRGHSLCLTTCLVGILENWTGSKTAVGTVASYNGLGWKKP